MSQSEREVNGARGYYCSDHEKTCAITIKFHG